MRFNGTSGPEVIKLFLCSTQSCAQESEIVLTWVEFGNRGYKTFLRTYSAESDSWVRSQVEHELYSTQAAFFPENPCSEHLARRADQAPVVCWHRACNDGPSGGGPVSPVFATPCKKRPASGQKVDRARGGDPHWRGFGPGVDPLRRSEGGRHQINNQDPGRNMGVHRDSHQHVSFLIIILFLKFSYACLCIWWFFYEIFDPPWRCVHDAFKCNSGLII